MDIRQLILNSPAASHWQRIGIRHHHGIDVFLAALRSHQSSGIGEFTDLIPLMDWCARIGFDIIQLLPLNDSGLDPSPYNALSASALNPIYLGLASLPHIWENVETRHLLEKLRQKNLSGRVAYQQVYDTKEKVLRHYFAFYYKRIAESEEYRHFQQKNSWVATYGLFQALRKHNHNAHWQAWPASFRAPTEEGLETLKHTFQSEVQFYTFVQFLCFRQLQEVSQLARAQGIFIKGDIPILISPNSADVWALPHQFNLALTAGAPPDVYSEEGQNWGFPLYRWDVLERAGFDWWKQRLGTAASFYDLYRLDHIVGFFRIWAIPLGKSGKEGGFIPSDTAAWIPQGEKILRMMLSHCPLLPIGEDLGIIPPEVRSCLRRLGIPGTKVMRWERHWETDKSFIDPHRYTPISMTTVSTHDSETLALWWLNNPADAEAFALTKRWALKTPLSIHHHQEILRESHHSHSLFHINLLQEYLALAPGMVWDNPNDERINVPGIISPDNWTYRYRRSVEEITTDPTLMEAMRRLLN